MEHFVYRQLEEVNFTINEIADRAEPRKILMATPTYFDIIDVKNVHMEGNKGNLDKDKAFNQWKELKKVFEEAVSLSILDKVEIIEGAKDCEDMVFCANQSFPWLDADGNKIVVLSKMRHESRKKEVPFFEAFYESQGYKIKHLQQTKMFEGMGDLIYHTGKKLLYGGFGHRTEKNAYNELAEVLQTPIIALELINENFYHLDTCFVSLGKEAVMICEEAFTQEGIDLLKHFYKRVYSIPILEAIKYFSLNALTLFDVNFEKKMAVLQSGSTITKDVLEKEGFIVKEVDTSEYMKSGGSVFCMKMMFY